MLSFLSSIECNRDGRFSLMLIAARWIPRDKRLDAAKEYSYSGERFNELADNVNIVQESNECQFTWLHHLLVMKLGTL